MSRQGFKHRGEVVGVELSESVVVVSIRSATACEGCHAKGHCPSGGGSGESSNRELRVVSGAAGSFSVGDIVEVGITYSIGFMAVMVAYLLPLILFILAIALLVGLGVDQGVAAICSFLVAALYYGGVYAMRDRFERVVNFEVRKL